MGNVRLQFLWVYYNLHTINIHLTCSFWWILTILYLCKHQRKCKLFYHLRKFPYALFLLISHPLPGNYFYFCHHGLLLNIMFLRFICVVSCIRGSFILLGSIPLDGYIIIYHFFYRWTFEVSSWAITHEAIRNEIAGSW